MLQSERIICTAIETELAATVENLLLAASDGGISAETNDQIHPGGSRIVCQ